MLKRNVISMLLSICICSTNISTVLAASAVSTNEVCTAEEIVVSEETAVGDDAPEVVDPVEDKVYIPMETIALPIKGSRTLRPDGLSKKERKLVTWSSSDTTVATVNEKGKVKARSRGITTITGVYANNVYTYKLYVNRPKLTKKNVTIATGERYWITLTGIISEPVTWKSSDESVAYLHYQVGSAFVAGVSPGKAKLTCRVGGKTYKVNVRVKKHKKGTEATLFNEQVLYTPAPGVPGETLYTASNGSAYSKFIPYDEEEVVIPEELKQFHVLVAEGYNGPYSENTETVNIVCGETDCKIEYSTDNGKTWSMSKPGYRACGKYKVDFRITKDGYIPYEGTVYIIITPSESALLTQPKGRELVYNGKAQELVVPGFARGTLYYSLDSVSWNEAVPKATEIGEYTVYFKTEGDANHSDDPVRKVNSSIVKGAGDIKVTVPDQLYDAPVEPMELESEAYDVTTATVTYDGRAYTATDASDVATGKAYTKSSTMPVNAGVYTAHITLPENDHYTKLVIDRQFMIKRADPDFSLNTDNINFTYPETGEIKVTENTSSGAISVTSTNDLISYEILPDNETVKLSAHDGDVNGLVTVKAAQTPNYNEASVSVKVKIDAGTITGIHASDAVLEWTGEIQYIDPIYCDTQDVTIKYGVSENCTYDNPQNDALGRKDIGTKRIYYTVTKPGYKTVNSYVNLIINKARATVTDPTVPNLVYTGEKQQLLEPAETEHGIVLYALGTEDEPTGVFTRYIPEKVDAGKYYIWYKATGDANHIATDAKCIASIIKRAEGKATVVQDSYRYLDTKPTYIVTSTTNSLVGMATQYDGTTYTEEAPAGTEYHSTDAPTYPGSYTLTVHLLDNANYNTVDTSCDFIVDKAVGTVTLDKKTIELQTDESATLTPTVNNSRGTLTAETSNAEVATVEIVNGDVKVTAAGTIGAATITVYSSSTTTYTQASTVLYVTTKVAAFSDPTVLEDNTKTFETRAKLEEALTAGGGKLLPAGITAPEGVEVTYSLSNSGPWVDKMTDDQFKLTDVGSKTIYYKLTKAGYTDKIGSFNFVVAIK